MSKADRVSEHDFLLRFLDDGNNQTECIVYLTIKKYFLVVFRMIINICKNLIEFSISLILIFELFQFYCADSFNESCVVNQEVSHLHEGIHDSNTDFYSNITSENRRKHRDSGLSEHIRQIASTAVIIT